MLTAICQKLGIGTDDQEIGVLEQATKPDKLIDQINPSMAENGQ